MSSVYQQSGNLVENISLMAHERDDGYVSYESPP